MFPSSNREGIAFSGRYKEGIIFPEYNRPKLPFANCVYERPVCRGKKRLRTQKL